MTTNRRQFIRQSALASAALAVSAPGNPAAGATRPNILLIITDDQRYDTLTQRFMPKTQAMLVDQGVLFPRGYVTTALCAPSRSSVLTGKYGRHTGVLNNKQLLTQPTFVNLLRGSGYYTGLVGKYLNPWDGSPRPEFNSWVSFAGGGSTYFDPVLNVNGNVRQHNGYLTHILRRQALRFLNDVPQAMPFLLLFTPNAPHAPFHFAPGYEDLYSNLAPHRPPSFNEADVTDKPAWLRSRSSLTAAQIAGIDDTRRKQLQMLRPVDDAIGEILSLLKTQGKLDNTLVVFMGDNGFFWGEHRLPGGKNRAYEEGHRVPFALRYPPLVPTARVEREIVANIDIAPTIYDLAGITIPGDVDGRSLVGLLKGAAGWRNHLLIEGEPNPPYRGVVTNRYVYIRNQGDLAELYDLNNDPFQLANVATQAAYAGQVDQLSKLL